LRIVTVLEKNKVKIFLRSEKIKKQLIIEVDLEKLEDTIKEIASMLTNPIIKNLFSVASIFELPGYKIRVEDIKE